MEIKVDGYSLEFDRSIVGLSTLVANVVALSAEVERASALILGVR